MKGLQQEKKDIVIPVMGATGAGKSFFINTLLRQETMAVGRDLISCTSELGFGYVETNERYPELKDYRILLVDTPGFDDTFETDFVILERIATWLKRSYKQGAKLGGVIYLHDISTPRFDGPARRTLQTFQRLCGEDVLGHVVLGTTKWVLNLPDFEEHHRQLEASYWRPLIDKGAQVRRFDNTYESAWNFIDTIISRMMQNTVDKAVLLIQEELVDKKLTLLETQAGADLRYTLQEVCDMQKKLQLQDAHGHEETQTQRKKAWEKVALMRNQLQNLRIPLSRRLRKFLGL